MEASRKFHTTVGVMSLPDVGVSHAGECLLELNTDLWRTIAANFRSKLEVGASRIGEADQLPDNVGRPIHLPDKVSSVFVCFNPDPSWRPVCVLLQGPERLQFWSLRVAVVNHHYT